MIILKDLKSKALETNLALTKMKQIIIPEDDFIFLNRIESFYGIHKRMDLFLKELYHPYPNYHEIVSLFRKILLEDYWFYHKNEYFTESQTLFLKYLNIIAHSNFDQNDYDRLTQTVISYVPLLINAEKQPDVTLSSFSLQFITFLKDYSEINPLVFSVNISSLLNLWQTDYLDQKALFDWLKMLILKCLDFWNDKINLPVWYRSKADIFKSDYGELFEQLSTQYLSHLLNELNQAQSVEDLKAIPSYNEIANHYRQIVNYIHSPFEQIYYLIYMLNNESMRTLYQHLIYDINKIIKCLNYENNFDEFSLFIDNLFKLFRELNSEYPASVLDCIYSFGKELASIKQPKLANHFTNSLISFGFQFANQINVSEDWQLIYNKNHVKNIRTYLDIYATDTENYKPLLCSLIVYLRIGGIFISDTDLFQKDVTKFLNADVKNQFKLVKQLCRIFPVYFNEIGAEGELREITTLLDQLTLAKDVVIHFLRKQIHTESNNTHIQLSLNLLEFWDNLNLDFLAKSCPDHVMINAKITEMDILTNEFLNLVKSKYTCSLYDLLEFSFEDLNNLEKIEFNDIAKKRLVYLIKIYKLLKDKYSFDSSNLTEYLKKYLVFSEKEILLLKKSLNKHDDYGSIRICFDFMNRLKKILLNQEVTIAREEIYYKRHIAAGIPSMYGRYIEPKFDALAVSLKLEDIIKKLVDNLISNLPLEYITASTLKRILKILTLIETGLDLDGIINESFKSNLKMLKYSLTSNSFSIDQYRNIFQFMQDAVREIINEFFFRNFDPVLKTILPVMSDQENNTEDLNIYCHKKSEIFYRDMLTSAFLIQNLDNFLSSIIDTFNSMQSNFETPIINQIMHFDHDKLVTSLDKNNFRLDNEVFLGAKAYYLKQLKNNHFLVPDGFVLTTELFRHKQAIRQHPAMSYDIDKIISKQIGFLEIKTKQKFGDVNYPLLLSVRSGAPLSMPGVMNTFLNIGLNDETTEALSKNLMFKWTAWDCYRRLIQSWGMAFGLNRDLFDELILDFKTKWSVELKVNFTSEQMKTIAYAYKSLLSDHGIYLEQDLYKQVRSAVSNVINSWDNPNAVLYRKRMEIAPEWGTAVVIQKMAFGNISLDSGTGVVFTHNPSLKKPGIHLYGDYNLCSQGEDVVGGLVHTRPVSEHQVVDLEEKTLSLEKAFPNIYNQLLHYAHLLIDKYGFNHQEIEFTFESDSPLDLYILQTRNQIIQKPLNITKFKDNQEFNILSKGTGIGLNVINGKVAFDMQDLEILKLNYPDSNRILIRPDTVPDDIPLIFESEAIITSKGGVSSHAAVTATRLGKTGILNCKSLKVFEQDKYCLINSFKIKTGDDLALDPNTGYIFSGIYKTEITNKIQ